ncbi:MAG: tellurium resistance protein TerC, partial [Chromatiales bacterium]|nr:tellurium resistance protein TerC [Chromatiales bacterium]
MSLWLSFGVLALGLLILLPELILLRRRQLTGTWEALAWTSFWIVLALAFNVAIYFAYEQHWFSLGLDLDDGPGLGHALDGRTASLQFFTAYIVQKSLSIDNVFVIAMIFAHFHVPLDQQQRLLTWVLLGTIVLRGAAIAGGVMLINIAPWMSYVFGVLLIFSALRVLAQRSGNPGADPVVRLLTRRW